MFSPVGVVQTFTLYLQRSRVFCFINQVLLSIAFFV